MYADRFTKPSFEDQFLIFRYKKIINDNLEEIAEKGTDIVDVIALDNHISQCEVLLIKDILNKNKLKLILYFF